MNVVVKHYLDAGAKILMTSRDGSTVVSQHHDHYEIAPKYNAGLDTP
jgi:hypothetical protein